MAKTVALRILELIAAPRIESAERSQVAPA
jgi:hypothetical protein